MVSRARRSNTNTQASTRGVAATVVSPAQPTPKTNKTNKTNKTKSKRPDDSWLAAPGEERAPPAEHTLFSMLCANRAFCKIVSTEPKEAPHGASRPQAM